MSVDAINGANAQQQPQKHSALPGAITSGIGLGVVGAGAGYFLGGKRPTLEQVFEQTPDTFTKKEVTEKDAEAAKKLQDAVHEVDTSTKAERKASLDASKKIADEVNKQTVDKQVEKQTAIDNARKALEEKEVEIDGNKFKQAEVKQELLEARKAVNSAKTDEEKKAAKDLLEEAEKKVQAFKEGTKDERKAFAEAKKDLATAKRTKFDNAAKVADSAEKKLVDAAEDASKKLTEAVNNKRTELLAKDEIKQAFEKIKDALPKEGKGKMAMIAGGIAAAVGLIGGYLMNSGHSDKA